MVESHKISIVSHTLPDVSLKTPGMQEKDVAIHEGTVLEEDPARHWIIQPFWFSADHVQKSVSMAIFSLYWFVSGYVYLIHCGF